MRITSIHLRNSAKIGEISLEDAVKFFKRRSEMAASIRRTVAQGPPQVERVSPFEVYLLNEHGERVRRVCGAKRGGLPEQFACLRPAGAGTDHKRHGRCSMHEAKRWPKPVKLGKGVNLLADAQKGLSYEKYLIEASKELQGSPEFSDLTSEVMDLTALRNLVKDKLRVDGTFGRVEAIIKLQADLDNKIIIGKKQQADIILAKLAAGAREAILERDTRWLLLLQFFNRYLYKLATFILNDQPLFGMDQQWGHRQLMEYFKNIPVAEIVQETEKIGKEFVEDEQ